MCNEFLHHRDTNDAVFAIIGGALASNNELTTIHARCSLVMPVVSTSQSNQVQTGSNQRELLLSM